MFSKNGLGIKSSHLWEYLYCNERKMKLDNGRILRK